MDPAVPAGAPPAEPLPRRRLRYGAAGLTSVAAFIHLVVMPEHGSEWWGYGLFFLFAAGLQAMFLLPLLGQPWLHGRDGRPWPDADRFRRNVYYLGVLGNAALIGFYVVTRTVGVPWLGPLAGRVEPVTLVGLLSKTTEAALVVVLLALIRFDARHAPLDADVGGLRGAAARHEEGG